MLQVFPQPVFRILPYRHKRQPFNRLAFFFHIDRMENGDVLIVTKLARLGRNAMDIRKTVEQLAASDIRVHLLHERTHSGIARAKAAGKNSMKNNI